MSTFTQGHLCVPSPFHSVHNGALVNLATGLVDANFALGHDTLEGAVIPGVGFAFKGDAGGDTNLYLFDLSFSLLHTVSLWSGSGGAPVVSNYSDTYYAVQNGMSTSTMKRISTAGTISGTVATLPVPIVNSAAVDAASSIYYYTDAAVGGALKRWNLSTNLALTDLVAGRTTNQYGEGSTAMICLPSGARAGDVLVVVQLNSAVNQWQVERYTPAGALAQTYILAANANAADADIVLSIDLTYPDCFWVRTYPTSDGLTSVFSMYSLNGTILQSVTGIETADMNSVPAFMEMFTGWSQVLTPAPPSGPFAPDSPTPALVGTRQTVPMKWVRRTSQVSDELLWQFVSEFQLMFQPGVGQANDPGKNPQIGLRWSQDGGNTWSNQRWVSAGLQGQYGTRAIWRMLGRGRDRVWEITSTDPVVWAIVDAFVKMEQQQ